MLLAVAEKQVFHLFLFRGGEEGGSDGVWEVGSIGNKANIWRLFHCEKGTFGSGGPKVNHLQRFKNSDF